MSSNNFSKDGGGDLFLGNFRIALICFHSANYRKPLYFADSEESNSMIMNQKYILLVYVTYYPGIAQNLGANVSSPVGPKEGRRENQRIRGVGNDIYLGSNGKGHNFGNWQGQHFQISIPWKFKSE